MNENIEPPQEDKVDIDLEIIAKAVPLIVGFLIFCGSLYLSTYYDCFHINIFNYLDTSEILVTFLYLIHDTAFIFAILVGQILLVKGSIWLIKKYRIWRHKNSNSSVPLNTENSLFSDFNKITLAIIIVSMVITVFYLIKSYNISINSNYILKNKDWMSKVLLMFTLIAGFWITAQLELRTKRSIRNVIVFILLFFISRSINKAIERVESTVNDVDLGSMIILDKDTLTTTPKYIYVGRTNKYVFFFNIDKQVADVIPQENIRKISFSYQKP